MNSPQNTPAPSANSVVAAPKKTYSTPRVHVHGDVRTLTGSGPSSGVSDIALSRNLFS